MPQDRPPAANRSQPIPWEALECLAAGELAPDEARTLRAKIEANAELAAACAQVAAIHEQLESVPIHAVPLGLVREVMQRVAPARARIRWPHIAAGWAAVVLISLAAWIGAAGAAPVLADGTPPQTWVASADAPDWLETLENGDGFWRPTLALPISSGDAVAWPWLLGGLLLLCFGVVNGVRMHGQAARGGVA